jgi:hypothetical protein
VLVVGRGVVDGAGVVGLDVLGCGAALVVAEPGAVDRDGCAELEAGDEDEDEEAEVRAVELSAAVVARLEASGGSELTPGVPSGALDSGNEAPGGAPSVVVSSPLRNKTAAAPTPSRQTRIASSATRRTGTSPAGPSSRSTARNAPQSAQTNSSSATRPHCGHVVISRIQ